MAILHMTAMGTPARLFGYLTSMIPMPILLALHPYAMPDELALNVIARLDRYLDWIPAETAQSSTAA